MSRAFSSGSVGFVLVCANLLPVTSHFMTPSTTHIGFTGSSPVQEIQGNPAHCVLLIRHFNTVPYWEYAVSFELFCANSAYNRTRYSRPPAPRLRQLICETFQKLVHTELSRHVNKSVCAPQIRLTSPASTCQGHTGVFLYYPGPPSPPPLPPGMRSCHRHPGEHPRSV